MPKTLNIIGCGRVGQTLGRLWAQTGALSIQQVLNRSMESTKRAVTFLGQGQAISTFDELGPADLTLIATGDACIETCAERLGHSNSITDACIVFHCSGAHSVEALAPVIKAGAQVGSLHPVKSFADPQRAVEDFDGTWCAVEGESPAAQQLEKLVGVIGGRPFRIASGDKTVYHAGAVLASNCLVALLETALRCYEKSGISRAQAFDMLRPFVQGTLNNVVALGTANALTGPIARGDVDLVRQQFDALKRWNIDIADTYQVLGRITAELSKAQGTATAEDLAQLEELLK